MKSNDTLKPLYWQNEAFYLLDQRILPEKEKYLRFERAVDVAQAIRDMVVRGAPAIALNPSYGIRSLQNRPNSAKLTLDCKIKGKIPDSMPKS